MADYDLEQLKSLFENLADRLDRTKGDQLSRDELYRIRVSLNRMASGIATRGANAPNQSTIIRDAIREIRNARPDPAGRATTPRRGTIIQEERARRGRDTSGNSILDRELRSASGSTGMFGRSVSGAANDTSNFGKRLREAHTNLRGASTAAAGVAAGMLKLGANRVDYYRELLASGEGSVSSMQDMGRQAAKAGLTVEQFVKAMSEGSQGARSLGAIKFGDVRKTVVEMSKASGYMGMLPDQITEVTSAYSEILRQQGMDRDINSGVMARGIMNLVKTSEVTAHILGKTREEALKAQAELAKDQQLNAVMRVKGIDPETARSLIDQVTEMYGNSGKGRLLDQLTFGQAGPDSAQFQAIDPAAADAIARIGDQLNRGVRGDALLTDAATELKRAGSELYNDRSRTDQFAKLARINAGGLKDVLTDALGGSALVQSLKTDRVFNRATDQDQNKEQRAGQGVLQIAESLQKGLVVLDSAVTAVFNPMVDKFGTTLRDKVLPALDSFSEKLISMNIGASRHTDLMGTLGAGILGVSTALGLLGGVIGFVYKGFSLFRGMSALGSLFGRGAGGAGGAGGRAGAGILARMAPALGAAGLVAGGATVGIGGTMAGGSMIQNRSGESFLGTGQNEQGFFGSRSSGYLTSILSGAAGGAMGGAAFAGIGAIPGAIAGGLAGLGSAIYNDWDNITGDASKRPSNATPSSAPRQAQQAPQTANATGQRGKTLLSTDQMTNKIMEASEQSAGYLRMIKDNGERQIELARDELAAVRAMTDRLSRLIEDVSKNTRTIADQTA